MKWDRLPDGDLKLAVLTGFAMAAGQRREVALRLEFAKLQEQLRGEMPPASEQLVMSADTAEQLAAELLAVVRRARGTEAN